jgi:hypothetical protein
MIRMVQGCFVRSVAAAWGGDGGGLARPAVARSGIDECCGQDFGAAQGVVTVVRGLLPSCGGIWCEQMSLVGTDVYYFYHSSWWHHLVSARLAVLPIAAVSAFLLGSVDPSHHRDAFRGETNGRQPVVAGNTSGAGAAGSGERSTGGLSPA